MLKELLFSNYSVFDVVIRTFVIICFVAVSYALNDFLKRKIEAIKINIEDYALSRYIALGESLIKSAVVAVNQTFVEDLKKNGSFTKEKQEEAFNRCKRLIMLNLTSLVKTAIEYVFEDVDKWIDTKIEYYVNELKSK